MARLVSGRNLHFIVAVCTLYFSDIQFIEASVLNSGNEFHCQLAGQTQAVRGVRSTTSACPEAAVRLGFLSG